MRTHVPGRFSFPPGMRGLRITSGIALALVPVLFLLSVILIVDEALSGSVGPSVLADVGGWMLIGSGVLGLAVLLVPARAMGRRVRFALLVCQCGLLPVAVVLAAAA